MLYTKLEQYTGVFDVTLKFIEYKDVQIRTADVPYIKRPGKNPVVKSKVINGKPAIGGKMSPYEAKSAADKIIERFGVDTGAPFVDETGKEYSNPCLVPEFGNVFQLRSLNKNDPMNVNVFKNRQKDLAQKKGVDAFNAAWDKANKANEEWKSLEDYSKGN